MAYAAFSPLPGGTVAVAATNVSQTVLVSSAPNTGPWQCLIYNPTAVIAFVREGTGTASITTDMPVAPGQTTIVTFEQGQSVGVILASGTGTIYLTPGTGY